MAGFDNDIIVGTGLDLSGSFPHQNRLNVDGALYIGNASGNPQAAVPTSSDDTLDIVAGPGTLDFKLGTGISGDFLQVANNLSDVPNDALARSNLGLSSMAIQSAAAVAITGGSITGITDLAVADGGTGRGSATEYAVICGGTTTTGPHQSIAGVGTSGQVLTSNGAAALPTFQDAGGGGNFVLISTATASASASVAFTDLSSTYYKYVVEITNLQPATDAVFFQMRTSTNNGVSYDSGAGNYSWGNTGLDDGASHNDANTSDTKIAFMADDTELMGNATNEINSITVDLINPSNAIFFTTRWNGCFTRSTGTRGFFWGGAFRLAAADVDAVQFTMSSGNIATGTFKLYGITAA